MEGIVVLGIIALYFILLTGCTVAGYKIAARRGLSKGKRWTGAAIGFAVIFLPVFWDAIPTLWMHRHYCHTEGGLRVYKTLDQWKEENPGVAEALTSINLSPLVSIPDVDQAYQLNQRIRWEIRTSTRLFGIQMRDERVTDSQTTEVLAKFVDFGTGIPNVFASGFGSFRDLKLWLDKNTCLGTSRGQEYREFGEFVAAAKNLGARE
jgi:hypothetical protein